MTGIFALHRGSWFGLGGILAWMLASLAMPGFAITGYWLWLERRKLAKKNAARRPVVAAPVSEQA